MKVVFLSYLHGFGGAEKQNVMLANAMADRGYNVTLVSICVDNNCYALDSRVRYLYLPDRGSTRVRLISRYISIKKLLKKEHPDVTVSFWFQSAYLTAFMAKRITGKIVYSERGDPGDKEYNGLLGIVRSISLPRIDGFVFQSKGAQSYFSRKIQLRSTVISNPVFINANDYPPVVNREKRIVTVGRLHPQKNQRILIDAFTLIAQDFPEYSLDIYGEGPLEKELQYQINSCGMTERIHLKGTSKRIHELIYNASLFVLSSDYEGLPNTLLEAMALGIPCISTDCRPGGAREIITNDKNGKIVPVGDVTELAKSMSELLMDSNKRGRFSIEGRKESKKYFPDVIYDKWNHFFEQINKN